MGNNFSNSFSFIQKREYQFKKYKKNTKKNWKFVRKCIITFQTDFHLFKKKRNQFKKLENTKKRGNQLKK